MPNSNPPFAGQTVAQAAQQTLIVQMLNAATSGNSLAIPVDGYNGGVYLLIHNGTGTCTLTVQGQFVDSASATPFTTAQDIMVAGVLPISTNAGTITARSVQSGALAIAASTTYAYLIQDPYPVLRLTISNPQSLAGLSAWIVAFPG